MQLSSQPPTPRVTVMSGLHEPMISTEQPLPPQILEKSCWKKRKWSSPAIQSYQVLPSLAFLSCLWLEVPGVQQFTRCSENL